MRFSLIFKAYRSKPILHIKLRGSLAYDGEAGVTGLGVGRWAGWKRDKNANNQKVRVAVPQCFPASAACIRTDVRTLLAFVILTAPDVAGAQSTWCPELGSYGSTSIKVTRINDTAIAHICGSFVFSRQSLTKWDISRMLDGFPPWYRKSVKNKHGVEFPFPIEDIRDVPRGGWVLAVGFTDTKELTQRPVPVCRLIDEPDKAEFREHGVQYRYAIRRCRDHIQKHILHQFLKNDTAERAIKSLNYLLEYNTNSFMPYLEFFVQVPMNQMTGSQLRFATKLFNKFRPLNDNERNELEPIMDQVLAACVLGAEEIVRYLKDDGVELKIPEGLGWLDDIVYLRDCSGEWKP
ncbi:hypothetical protein LTR70_001383 [Exophiala xenobiotica]|uniref:Uncharacterized protein n=1 Tax=Lithohypha guttulata TaxID=1690604 RepID=A0ABR0KPD5_9EURO|nr:hypothetical protein LTR24_000862 [Lithohypha guttulata]KAK5328062.1 hypothetical protein LTR70_001383 [Exophiala xenobiotica]